MFDDVFGLVQVFIQEIAEAKLMELVGLLATVAALFLPVSYYLWRNYRLENFEKQELDNLCKTRAELLIQQKREIDKQAEIIAEQRSWFLDSRLQEIKKERHEGN